ncbi:MAG: hypothetical protein LUF90_05755 [Rikenellaceae bacterium]|nr:hypothetical protein [Rikenellaceae bacterium]
MILAICVGGGSYAAARKLYNSNLVSKENILVIDTDISSLERLKLPRQNKLPIGDGSGAKHDPKVGRSFAIESYDLIHNTLSQRRFSSIFILSCLGGGTGTGATPVIADLCRKEFGKVTVTIASLPYAMEGVRRQEIATNSISELKANTDSLILLSNDSISSNNPLMTISEAFEISSNYLISPIEIINSIITSNGFVNLDFADVSEILKMSGLSVVTDIFLHKDGLENLKSQLKASPFISDNDLKRSKNALVQISTKREISSEIMTTILNDIQTIAQLKVDIMFGIGIDEQLSDNTIKVSIILSGINEEEYIEISSLNPLELKREIPTEVAHIVDKIRKDHEGKKIAFMIMRFGSLPIYNKTVDILRACLAKRGIVLLRADDREYTDDLYYNIIAHLHACDFAIALFENYEGVSVNANVSFEVGYMYGIRKDVCLLKDRSLPRLHTDIIGKIYKEYDSYQIDETLPSAFNKWLDNKGHNVINPYFS